jgi:hypothetical protein
MRLFFLCVLVVCFPFFLAGQTPPSPPSIPPVTPETEPVPYGPDEFPQWSRSLRRSEIIAVGLFPFMYLFSSFGYDAGRYAAHGFNSSYAPGFFGSADSVSKTRGEKNAVILAGVGLSLAFAVIDFIIESSKPERPVRR